MLINKNIDRAYGTDYIVIRFTYPGVKTTGLQYESYYGIHSSVQEASSGGTTDIVAMEFIPLQK